MKDRLTAIRNEGDSVHIGFFKNYASHYASLGESYVKKATLAGDKQELEFQNNKQTTDFTASILSGNLNYDEIVLASKGKVVNSDIQSNVFTAINKAINLKVSEMDTQEDLEEFKVWSKGIMTQYNANKYLGGSNSAKAVDLQTKINNALQTTIKNTGASLAKQSTDYIANQVDLGEMNPKLLNQSIDSHPTWTADKKAMEKRKYESVYKKKESLRQHKNNFNLDSANNNITYKTLPEDQKKWTKNLVFEKLDFSLETGAYSSFASTAVKNEEVGKGYVKSIFNFEILDGETASKNLAMYRNLKDVEHGSKVLTYLDADTIAFYEILDENPQFTAEMIQGKIVDSRGLKIRFGEAGDNKTTFKNNKKDWEKLVIGKISFKERKVAERLLTIYSNLMDPEDAIQKVADTYVKMDGQEAQDGMQFRGFSGANVDYIEAGLKDYIFKDTDFDTDALQVSFDKGVMTVIDAENPLIPALKMSYNDFKSAIAVLKVQEVDEEEETAQTKIDNVKRFTNSMAHPYYDGGGMFQEGGIFYKPHKQKQAADDWEEFKGMISDFFSSTKAVTGGNHGLSSRQK